MIKAGYEDCKWGGITINGIYQNASDLHQGEFLALDTVVQEHHTGKLQFSGKVTGECDIDVHLEHLITKPESPTRTGTFCGHDITSLQ